MIEIKEWSGSCDPCDPANYRIDDNTGERVSAATGERSEHQCLLLDEHGVLKQEYDELVADTTWPKSLVEHEAEFNATDNEGARR